MKHCTTCGNVVAGHDEAIDEAGPNREPICLCAWDKEAEWQEVQRWDAWVDQQQEEEGL